MTLYAVTQVYAKELIAREDSYEALTLNADNSDLVLWLQSILYLIDNSTQTTMKFDKTLEEKIVDFQASFQCSEEGCVDFETWQQLFLKVKDEIERVSSPLITDEDITKVAVENDLSPAAVKAVLKVESRGRGYQIDGRLLILFEGHKFYDELKRYGLSPNDYVVGNEDIIFPKYDKGSYAGNQYARLERAKAIHEEAALKSTSWGLFQIMGFNHELAGFTTVQEYVEILKIDEKRHLEAFIVFIKNTDCFQALKDKNWAKFARSYNGSSYRENRYDEKMEKQYNSSNLTKSIGEVMDEEAYVSHYALELEKAFHTFDE